MLKFLEIQEKKMPAPHEEFFGDAPNGAQFNGHNVKLHDGHATAKVALADDPELPGRKEGIVLDVNNLVEAISRIIDASPDVSTEEKAIIRDHIEMALYEASLEISEASKKGPLKAPVRQLSADEIEAVKRRGQLHPWSARGDDRRWPVDWVRYHYSEWIPGLLKGHILQADPPLYAAFMKHISRKGMPSDLDIPTEAENKMRSITDPRARRVLTLGRKLHAHRCRAARPD